MAFIAFLAIRHNQYQTKALNDAYARVASRLGGSLLPGSWLSHPQIRFRAAGGAAKIDVYSTGGKHPKLYTQLHLPWHDRDLRCEVYPLRFLHGVGKMFGMEDIPIGSPAFDERYIIRGNSEVEIRRLLSGSVQHAIDELRNFLGNNDIYVSIRGGRLLIKKYSLIRDRASLDRLVRLGLQLHEAASHTNSEGIDFVDGDDREAALSLTAAICQVCGDEISDDDTPDVVFCRSCKTPHHRDCWQYYGNCSTYGCGQKRFLVAKQGRKQDGR